MLLYLHSLGQPQSFSCQCRCTDVHHSGRCTVMWDKLPSVSCNPMRINVSLMLQNGTAVYSDNFGLNITSTQTTPMNLDTVYTAAVIAQNECGSVTCSASCSAGKRLINLELTFFCAWVRIDSTWKYCILQWRSKRRFQYAIKTCVGSLLGGLEACQPPRKRFGFLTFWGCFWCILGVKLQKLDELLLNLVVVFKARRIKGVTQSGHRGCKAAVYLHKLQENKCSHTDIAIPL